MKSSTRILRGMILGTIVLILAVFSISTAQAYKEGPHNAGAGASVPGIGSEVWQNTANITAADGQSASVVVYQGHRYSEYLQGTQYGFNIPLDVTIVGIEVDINRRSDSRNPNVIDNVVSLVKGGVIVGENKASALQWPILFNVATYGGPTDLWGTEWTPADINATDFGAVLAVYRDNNGNTQRSASVDYIQISVYYAYTTSTALVCGDGNPVYYGDSIICVATVSGGAGELIPTGNVDWSTDINGVFNPNPCILELVDGVNTCSTVFTPYAGESTVQLVTSTYVGDDFFATSSASQEVTILPRPITVTADPQAKIFGQADPPFTYQITEGSLVFTDTFTGSLTREPGEDVGEYAILQGSLALPATYDLSYIGSSLTITKADPVCIVTPYDITYDGTAHVATGTCTGVLGEVLSGLDLSGTAHTNAGSYIDTWTFTDVTGNYNDVGGSVTDNIGKAEATCLVQAYNVTYDGNAHSANGNCTGVSGEPLTGLDLSATTHTVAGNYTDGWTFTDTSGNYTDQDGQVNDIIAKAIATCVVTPYDVIYDGNPHTAVGSCTGVDGEPLVGLDLTGTTHTNAGSYLADPWSFSDVTGNYTDQSGTVEDIIDQAVPLCLVEPYNVTYDGFAHTATGACTGINGEPLTGLDLSDTTHLSAGSYNDPWTFIDESGNYHDDNGIVVDTIGKAEATCEISGYDVTYDGNPHTATGFCTGVNGEPLSGLDLDGTSHTNAGSYTDPWNFIDQSGNYNNQSGTVDDLIGKADATCVVSGYNLEYDKLAHTASGTCTGVSGEVLAGLDLTSTTHTAIGVYPNDPWTFTDVTGNYNDDAGSVNDQITVRAITIVADDKSKAYGQPDPALTFHISVGSLLEGDTFSGSLVRVPGESLGTYPILRGNLTLPDYYEITFVGANFTITGYRMMVPLVMR